MTIAASTDGDIFLAYLEQILCPRLRPGQIDSDHWIISLFTNWPEYLELIEAAGARLVYLPPYSPDSNPIVVCVGIMIDNTSFPEIIWRTSPGLICGAAQ